MIHVLGNIKEEIIMSRKRKNKKNEEVVEEMTEEILEFRRGC